MRKRSKLGCLGFFTYFVFASTILVWVHWAFNGLHWLLGTPPTNRRRRY